MQKTALLTSYEKNDTVVRLAKILVKNGWNILGSAGTTSYLKENGIACVDAAVTVGPPILGHRVVTLSREIYAGLLASTPEDFAELERLHILNIDLVYVNLYPLEKEIESPQATPESVLEKTDIGGPTLLRAAAKGRRLALSAPKQIETLELWLSRGSPETEREQLTLRFAAEAERRVAEYVSVSANYWEQKIA
jgi:phosphoribosylaminoimidazolecarboxamide formyltransferase / IMP cyclohydrolase